MPRVAPIQNTFNAGELSPSLEGRTDFDKYKAGCYRVENFIPLVQGPAEYRPGLHFVAQTKSNNLNRSWLVPFHFNQTQSYAIEVGDRYARFFYQRGQLLDSTSAPYEITAPYTANDLINADGTFRPSFAQSNDVLFFAQSGYYPQMLERHGHTDWAFRPFGLPAGSYNGLQVSFQGPMGATNIDKGKKLYASATTGVVTLTALVGAIFEPWMAGRYMMIEDDGLGPDTVPWQSGKVVALNDIRRVGNRHYIAITAGTSGGVQPVHTDGHQGRRRGRGVAVPAPGLGCRPHQLGHRPLARDGHRHHATAGSRGDRGLRHLALRLRGVEHERRLSQLRLLLPRAPRLRARLAAVALAARRLLQLRRTQPEQRDHRRIGALAHDRRGHRRPDPLGARDAARASCRH
jgi:hypothetical protein